MNFSIGIGAWVPQSSPMYTSAARVSPPPKHGPTTLARPTDALLLTLGGSSIPMAQFLNPGLDA